MARNEADREDLLREAVALKRRAELRYPSAPEPVVAGFRAGGSLSVYFGADPAYHFDPAGRLRRAFVDGHLYRTQGQTLARLTRVRGGEATVLERHDLSDAELKAFAKAMRSHLAALASALSNRAAHITAQVPADDKQFLCDLQAQLATIRGHGDWLAPAIKGKR